MLGVITLRPGIAAGEPSQSRHPQLNHVENACLFLVDSFRVSVRLHGVKLTSNSTLGITCWKMPFFIQRTWSTSQTCCSCPRRCLLELKVQIAQVLMEMQEWVGEITDVLLVDIDYISVYWKKYITAFFICCIFFRFVVIICLPDVYFNTIDNVVQCNLLYLLYAMCILHYALWSVVHTTFTKALNLPTGSRFTFVRMFAQSHVHITNRGHVHMCVKISHIFICCICHECAKKTCFTFFFDL